MKHTAPLQRQTQQFVTSAAKSRATLNPLQLNISATNQNPLQLKPGNNPLQLRSNKENKTGLPDELKAGIENLSGFSMDDVSVHYNSDKPEQLQALAYAQGTDIHIAPGQEKHLPHEAWHVVQQKQGRVKATVQMKSGVGINDDRALEREADTIGERAEMARVGQHNKSQQAIAHGKGCGCSSCTGALMPVAGSRQDTPAVFQLKPCPIHSDDPGYDGHSDRNCPDLKDDDSESEEVEATPTEVSEKVPGWKKKGGSGAVMGKGERDLRKRQGHGMMTKDQAKRYVSNYKK